MNLDYRILWFENERGSFNAKQRLVKRVVENFGFNFPDPRNEADDSNIDNINYQLYDLIIADLNLDNDIKGTGLLEKIRAEKGIFTEVVFYSSIGESALRQELKNFEIDGVYCASRSDDDFREKVAKVIETTIKKVQDVNNARGLVIAESITLENEIEEILLNFFKTAEGDELNQEKADLLRNIYDRKIKQQQEFSKLLNEINFKDIQKLIETDVLTASNGIDALSGILKVDLKKIKLEMNKKGLTKEKRAELQGRVDKIETIKSELVKFNEEILKIRNTLAHVEEEIAENGIPFLKSLNKKDGTTIMFDDAKYVEIREVLKRHKKNLQEIALHLNTVN